MFNHMAKGAIAWSYVSCFTLFIYFFVYDMWYGLTLCKIEGQVLS